MKLLVFDFLRRWWWVMAIFVLLTGFSAVGMPMIFAPVAIFCLVLDAGRGLFRVVGPLPLSRRNQALSWWFIGVLLVPLLSLMPLVLGTEYYVWNHASRVDFSPWFYAAVSFLVGLGYGGFSFLLATSLPTRSPVGLSEWTKQGIINLLWGFSFSGLSFVLPNLPKTAAAILPWHTMLFVAAPLCVLLSFLAAPGLLRRRMFVIAAKPKTLSTSKSAANPLSGLTGWPLYFLTFIGRGIGFIALILILQNIAVNLGQHSAQKLFVLDSTAGFQVAVFAIFISAITVDSIGVRALRGLPLSTTQLTFLLLSVPCGLAVFGAIYTAFVGKIGDPASPSILNFITQALAFTGMASLTSATLLHSEWGGRLFLILPFGLVTIVGLIFLGKSPLLLGLLGSFACALAFGLIHRGLRKSNTFYKLKHQFGTTPGQPLGVR